MKRVVLIVLSVALCLATAVSVSCGPTAPPAPTAEPRLSLDQPAQAGGLQITIGNLRRIPKPESEEEFLIFQVTAENLSDANKTIHPNDFFLVDGKGQRKTYEWDPPKEAGARLRQSYLAPKEKVAGDVSFLVPRGDSQAVLTYQEPVAPRVMNPHQVQWNVK